MTLLDCWKDLRRRIDGTPVETIAGSGKPANPEQECIHLPAGTDYKRLAIALIERCGYVVIDCGRKVGRPAGSRKKAGGIVLPTGRTLARHVEILKEDAQKEGRKLNTRVALRRILRGSIGHVLKEQGASEARIKTAIERELRSLERRHREARKPRRRK